MNCQSGPVWPETLSPRLMGCLFCPKTKAGHGVVVVKVVVVVVVVAVEGVVMVVVVVSLVGSVLELVVVKVVLVIVVVVLVAIDVHLLLPDRFDELYREDCEGCQEGRNLNLICYCYNHS